MNTKKPMNYVHSKQYKPSRYRQFKTTIFDTNVIELNPLLGAETDVFTKIVIKADPYWFFCENT